MNILNGLIYYLKIKLGLVEEKIFFVDFQDGLLEFKKKENEVKLFCIHKEICLHNIIISSKLLVLEIKKLFVF